MGGQSPAWLSPIQSLLGMDDPRNTKAPESARTGGLVFVLKFF